MSIRCNAVSGAASDTCSIGASAAPSAAGRIFGASHGLECGVLDALHRVIRRHVWNGRPVVGRPGIGRARCFLSHSYSVFSLVFRLRQLRYVAGMADENVPAGRGSDAERAALAQIGREINAAVRRPPDWIPPPSDDQWAHPSPSPEPLVRPRQWPWYLLQGVVWLAFVIWVGVTLPRDVAGGAPFLGLLLAFAATLLLSWCVRIASRIKNALGSDASELPGQDQSLRGPDRGIDICSRPRRDRGSESISASSRRLPPSW